MMAPVVRGIVVAAGLVAIGCGTDAQGTDACRRIEQARCQRAMTICPDLGIRDEAALTECLGAARDACLHGLPVADPGTAVVDRCVAAIAQTPTCAVVVAPETSPECSFLVPQPAPDAAASVDSGSE